MLKNIIALGALAVAMFAFTDSSSLNSSTSQVSNGFAVRGPDGPGGNG